jgi:pimeloyl-ACP methyl ester carboxylesterase
MNPPRSLGTRLGGPVPASLLERAVQECAHTLSFLVHDTPVGLVGLLRQVLRTLPGVALSAWLFKLFSYASGRSKHLLHRPGSSGVKTLLNLYLLLEAAFALVHASFKARGQAARSGSGTGAAACRVARAAERRAIVQRCLDSVRDAGDFIVPWFSRADSGAVRLGDIRRGNLEQLFGWAFFDKQPAALDAEERCEVDEYLAELARSRGVALLEGHNGALRCKTFTHEPVESSNRPLVYYLITHLVVQRVVAPLSMRTLGFGALQTAPRCFNYYVRRARSGGAGKTPIVFFHGIGLGPQLYVKNLRALVQVAGGARDMLVVEMPAIAQQLFPKPLLPDSFVQDLRAVLRAEGFEGKACFVGHSYGTFVQAWVVKRAPELVHSLAFLDPGPFMLHNSVALQAIVYATPQSRPAEMFAYYMREELFFNNHLRRDFQWRDNSLFFEQISPDTPALVIMSESDGIMPVQEVELLYKLSKDKHDMGHVDLLVLPDAIHAFVMLTSYADVVAGQIENMLLAKESGLLAPRAAV